MSNNLYVCEFNLDQISEFDHHTAPPGRSFAVGDGPAALALRTNRYPGDLDENSTVNPVDVIYLVNYVYKSYPLPGSRVSVADVNHDCHINPVDIVLIVNYVYRNYGRLLWGCMP